jgi:uncharacterized protein YgbK (DUF1537 family)
VIARIVIIADDLSGAAEVAGIAAARGLIAEVHRSFDPSSPAPVIAIDTNSRRLPPARIAIRMRAIEAKMPKDGPAWVFKKVDSLLRGNPRAEIEALVEAFGFQRALLIPANPSRERTIDGGQYLIDGVPLDKTPFAHDAEFPRDTSSVRSLLGRISMLPIHLGMLPIHIIGRRAPLPQRGIIVPDVTDLDDLKARTNGLYPPTLAAGAADFFAACLDELLGSPPLPSPLAPVAIAAPALLVCGSQIGWQQRRKDCLAAGLSIVEVGAASPVAPAREQLASSAADCLSRERALVLAIGSDDSAATSPVELLQRLVTVAATVIQTAVPATVLLEGGATASAVARALGWKRFSVVATAATGAGRLRPLAAPLAPSVLIKPGSYSWSPEIWEAFCACRG